MLRRSASRLRRVPAPVAAGGFPDITAPAGALGFTTTPVTAQAGSTYRLAFLDVASKAFPDLSLYAYRYKFAAASDESLAIGSLQSGTKYYRIADVDADGATVGDVSVEFTTTPV